MIEVIYKEEKRIADEEVASFSVPRNIRQVGLIGENFRIYMEDYVYTFLKKLSDKRGTEYSGGHLAILKGETHWKNEITYVFVRGAVLAKTTEVSEEKLILLDKDWEQIHLEEQQYFPDEETVGWFFSEPGLQIRMNPTFDAFHLKYFGADKICFLMDPIEREEAFFRYENNNLIRQSGYYLYYEKNPNMQIYMVEKKQQLVEVPKEKPDDDAVKSFRQKIAKNTKGEAISERKEFSFAGFLNYAASACLAVTVLAAGYHFYRNYRQMEEIEQSAERASSQSVVTPTVTSKPISPTPELEKISPTPTQIPKSEQAGTKKTKTSSEETQTSTERKMEAIVESEDNSQDSSEESSKAQKETSSPMHNTYVIRPGDTLFQICLENYGSLDRLSKLCELNGISENDVIYPGEIIVLP